MTRRQLPRAAAATLDATAFLPGEIAVDLTNDELRYAGDGGELGGIAIARKDGTNLTASAAIVTAAGGNTKTLAAWTALINALGSTAISTAMAPVVTASTRLNALYQLNKEIGVYIPSALTDTAIQAAIDEAYAAGGGAVLCAAEDYAFTSGITPKDNVAVYGVHGSTRFVGSGSSSFSFVKTAVADVTVIADLASDAAVNDRTVTLTSGSGVAVGDVIRFVATHPTSSQVHQWLTQVIEKSGAVLTMGDPMPIAVASADTHEIAVLAPEVSNFVLRDIILDLGTNTGTTSSAIFIVGAINLDIGGIEMWNFGGESRGGLFLSNCLHAFVRDMYSENCGSLGSAAQWFSVCSNVNASALRSYNDAGFGIEFTAGAYNQGSGLSSTRAGEVSGGRGIKFNADLRGMFSDVISNNSAYTGVMFSNHCYQTQVHNVQTLSNGFAASNHGLAFNGDYETGVRVRGLLSLGNSTYDVVFAANTTDCIVTDATYETVSNIGTNCYLSTDNSIYVTATDKVLGRSSAGGGAVEEIAFTSAARALCDDADAATQRATMGVAYASTAETQAQSSIAKVLSPASLAVRPAFRAHKNGTQQSSIASVTFTKLTFGTASVNAGSLYDAANSKWVPPAGAVRLSAAIYVSAGLTTGQIVQIDIYKNGGSIGSSLQEATATWNQLKIDVADVANGMDYYEVYFYGTSGSSITVNGSTSLTYFCGSCC